MRDVVQPAGVRLGPVMEVVWPSVTNLLWRAFGTSGRATKFHSPRQIDKTTTTIIVFVAKVQPYFEVRMSRLTLVLDPPQKKYVLGREALLNFGPAKPPLDPWGGRDTGLCAIARRAR